MNGTHQGRSEKHQRNREEAKEVREENDGAKGRSFAEPEGDREAGKEVPEKGRTGLRSRRTIRAKSPRSTFSGRPQTH